SLLPRHARRPENPLAARGHEWQEAPGEFSKGLSRGVRVDGQGERPGSGAARGGQYDVRPEGGPRRSIWLFGLDYRGGAERDGASAVRPQHGLSFARVLA